MALNSSEICKSNFLHQHLFWEITNNVVECKNNYLLTIKWMSLYPDKNCVKENGRPYTFGRRLVFRNSFKTFNRKNCRGSLMRLSERKINILLYLVLHIKGGRDTNDVSNPVRGHNILVEKFIPFNGLLFYLLICKYYIMTRTITKNYVS